VSFELLSSNEARITNVRSWRHRKDVKVDVPGLGRLSGDVAWGGNWFFLTDYAPCPLVAENIPRLTSAAQSIQDALNAAGVSGDGAPIDHIEIFGPPSAGGNSRSFVLCPGGAYDRSPCGTGTSAKLACLAADGNLAPGGDWVQESVIGSKFTARYALATEGGVIPTITGAAYVTGDATLLRDPADPFADGIRFGT
jgi:4-hydroxyproline epimerase